MTGGGGHGGNVNALAARAGVAPGDLLDFSASINPLGFPDWLRAVISARTGDLAHYPDPYGESLARMAAKAWGVSPEEIAVGNGSSELLYAIPRVAGSKRAIVVSPAYADYARAARLAGIPVELFFTSEADNFAPDLNRLAALVLDDDLVFIGSPNNPTGVKCGAEGLRALANAKPKALFVIDEAFIDFVESAESLARERPRNVIVLRSLTKFYAMPGLRLGCAVANAEFMERLRESTPPWSVNTLALAVGAEALGDDKYAARTRESTRRWRDDLTNELGTISGLKVYPGAANFLLARCDSDSAALAEELLLTYKIAIRACGNFEGLDKHYFRVAVRTPEENAKLCGALAAILGMRPGTRPTSGAAPRRKRTPAIMFQGTSSNAGKSVLTAALCRILLQDGWRVAPFKAQNMSLNSFVTRNGREMGRAQATQAQACKLDPDSRMNPVLLKPNSETGSQVIVLGKPVGNMEVGAYFQFKKDLFETVKDTYDSLADDYEVIVLEGAGSPAEVNLKRHDIVNMRMARHAGAPVLLTGDIDRGGVFASFIGSMETFEELERRLVGGFVINRFRGQESLLGDAIDYTERFTGVPTLGVVPHVRDLGLPEEDSVTFKSGALDSSRPAGACVEIAVVDLPHISNFTDFDALRLEPDVYLRVARSAGELGCPDALILPGSKNVPGDLNFLRVSGLAEKISALAAAGKTELVGVCGGLQMLGREIDDPHRLESADGATLKGLGLLAVTTTLEREKTLTRANARHLESGLPLKGYEIHHGRTAGLAGSPCVTRDDGEVIGAASEDGLFWGTYLHGVFDADEFRRWFIDRLRARKALTPLGKVQAVYDLEPALDRLAEIVRRSLKMDAIYKLMGLK